MGESVGGWHIQKRKKGNDTEYLTHRSDCGVGFQRKLVVCDVGASYPGRGILQNVGF